MAKYLLEASYTSEGVQGLLREGGTGRRSAIEATISGAGGRVEAFYFAFGDVDVYVIVELPDNVSANAVSLAINESGLLRLKTAVLVSAEEIDEAIAKHVEYRPPGR